jgi:hypothetical protein
MQTQAPRKRALRLKFKERLPDKEKYVFYESKEMVLQLITGSRVGCTSFCRNE